MPAPERRAALITAAKDAFAERGFAATSMDDVANAAGVSRLIVYRHFESKEALYDAVASETGAMLDEALFASTDTPGFAAVRALLTVARADPHGFTVLWEHVAREPQFSAHADFFNAWKQGQLTRLVNSCLNALRHCARGN